MIKLNFTNESGEEISEEFFKKILQRFCKILKKKVEKYLEKGEVSLVLVDDKKIQELNRDYRGKDVPTDVLSFVYLDPDTACRDDTEMPIIIGDIFISIPTAKRQAKEKGHDLKKECKILFIHGLLHLFGFDHNTDEEEMEMEKWAKKILAL